MTYRELLEKGTHKLQDADVPDAQVDARLLLEHVLGITRSDILAHGDRLVDQDGVWKYDDLVEMRSRRIPLQQLTGEADFMGLPFKVNESVLIPRQDTEILVEEILRDMHGGMNVLDMCTGSGCILISLLHYSNECTGLGVDISREALEVARENAEYLIPEENCRFVEGDLFENVTGRFDVLVSNPPYIASSVIDTLMPEVKEHEPRIALDGREDGLHFYRRILEECPPYLNGGAQVFFEIGYDQGEAVKEMMLKTGFQEVTVVKDYAGLDRVVHGTYHLGNGL